MFKRKKASGDNSSTKDNGSGSSTGSVSSSRVSGSRDKSKKALSKAESSVSVAHMNSKVKSTSASGPRSSTKEVSSISKNMDRLSMRDDDVKSSSSQQSIQSAGAGTPSGTSKDKKKSKHSISYAAERVIGNGSFGVVYQATVIETGETVAIKKVLQDRRFKNRELQIMRMLDHPSVVALKHSFLAKGDKVSQPDDVYLNLVMEYIPETIHRQVRNHFKAKKSVPLMYIKVYMYQMCRALAYIHSQGICHRDIKPQNLLMDPQTHVVKLCDFGSAKILAKGQPNVAYICSRYYRAPELVFEATEYTTAIDIWSLGCVMAELLLGKPLFAGESTVDQLIEIIKILGTPTREEIYAMNPNHTTFNFPQITAHPWSKVFRYKAPKDAVDLVSRFLVYKPLNRLDPFEALTHTFFDDLRKPDAKLPNGKPCPSVFNWTKDELIRMQQLGLTDKLNPPHIRKAMVLPSGDEGKSSSEAPLTP